MSPLALTVQEQLSLWEHVLEEVIKNLEKEGKGDEEVRDRRLAVRRGQVAEGRDREAEGEAHRDPLHGVAREGEHG